MNAVTEPLSYSSKFKQKQQFSSLSKKPEQLQAKLKIKLDPLISPKLIKTNNDLILTKNKNPFECESPTLKFIEKNSQEYVNGLRKVLGIPLISRESQEAEQTPLVKIGNQTPFRYRSRFSKVSISERDSPKLSIKTEQKSYQQKLKSKVNFSIGSEYDLQKGSLPDIQGSLEEIRVLLRKVKNSNI